MTVLIEQISFSCGERVNSPKFRPSVVKANICNRGDKHTRIWDLSFLAAKGSSHILTLMTDALISGEPLLASTINVLGLIIDFWNNFSLRESGIMSIMEDSRVNRPVKSTK